MPVEVNQATQSNAITLKGSAQLIGDFLSYGINSILYQRGVYPENSFSRQKPYGFPVFVTDNDKVKEFIQQFVDQLKAWLERKSIQKVVLLITSLERKEDIEKWQFKIECDKSANETTQQTEKPLKEIQSEMRVVLRQIVSSVTFLPNIYEECSFDILAYTDLDCTVPAAWEPGKEHDIIGGERVKLSSVSTLLHKVDMDVCYKTN